jgi:hypothetical protein
MQQEQHDRDAQQQLQLLLHDMPQQLHPFKQDHEQKLKPQTGAPGIHASSPPTPPPAAVPRGELLRQAHHMQQRAQPSPCSIKSTMRNFRDPQAAAHTGQVVRPNRTRRAPVALLPLQHAAPPPPPLHLPSIAASADGAAACPNSLCPFHYEAGCQAAAAAALQVQQAAAAGRAVVWAPQRDGAVQVRLCVHSHVIYHCYCHYCCCRRDAPCSDVRHCTPSSRFARSKVAHEAEAANAARAAWDVAACCAAAAYFYSSPAVYVSAWRQHNTPTLRPLEHGPPPHSASLDLILQPHRCRTTDWRYSPAAEVCRMC